MTPQEFCYWLQGYFEVSGNETLTPEQVKMVKEHLQLVFRKETVSVVVKMPEPGKPDKNNDTFTKGGLQEAYRKWVTESAKGNTIMTCHTNVPSPQYQITSWPFGQTKEEYFKEHGYYPPASC